MSNASDGVYLNSGEISIAICDDEDDDRELYRSKIEKLAAKYGIALKLVCYKSGKEALFKMGMRDAPVDILYLAVMMPGENGIDVARELRNNGLEKFQGDIIFMTHVSDYAIDAFDVRAFHYILKESITDDKFEKIFLSVVSHARATKRKHVVLRGSNEYKSVNVDSIDYFDISNKVVTVHYGNNEHFDFVSTMEKVIESLDQYGFVRVHRSFVVPVAKIGKLSYTSLKLKDNIELPVGRKYYEGVKRALEH